MTTIPERQTSLSDERLLEVLETRLRCLPHEGRLFWRSRAAFDFPSEPISVNWNKRFAGKEAFRTLDSKGYFKSELHVDGKRVPLLAHRVIFSMAHGYIPKGMLDHIDGNPQNNCIDNLREVSPLENMWNAVKPRGRYLIGARWSGTGWYSSIIHCGKETYLGSFKSEVAAHRAYMAKAIELRGEFVPVERLEQNGN